MCERKSRGKNGKGGGEGDNCINNRVKYLRFAFFVTSSIFARQKNESQSYLGTGWGDDQSAQYIYTCITLCGGGVIETIMGLPLE